MRQKPKERQSIPDPQQHPGHPDQQEQQEQQGQQGQQEQQGQQHLNWSVTPGVSHIHNIIRIHLFRHYEKQITTYKLLMLCNIQQSNQQRKLVVLEAEEVPHIYKGIAISPFFDNLLISTSFFKSTEPCIVALVRIDNDLILMSKEEFEALSPEETEDRENGGSTYE